MRTQNHLLFTSSLHSLHSGQTNAGWPPAHPRTSRGPSSVFPPPSFCVISTLAKPTGPTARALRRQLPTTVIWVCLGKGISSRWLEYFWIIKKNVIQMAGERGFSTSAEIKPYFQFPSFISLSSLHLLYASSLTGRPTARALRRRLAHRTDISSPVDHHIRLAMSTPARSHPMRGHHAHPRTPATTTVCSCVHRTENSSCFSGFDF